MQKIQVEVVVDAGIEKVWEFWTTPEKIQGWAFASDDWECPYATNDVRVGGRFLTRMSAKDKSFGFDFTGTYTEVIRLEKLQYVMDKADNETVGRVCAISFESLSENQTIVTTKFDSEDVNPIEMQKNGWQSIANNFKKLVETT